MNHLHNNIGGLVVQISSLQEEVSVLMEQKKLLYGQLLHGINNNLSINEVLIGNTDFSGWLKQGEVK